MELLRVVCAIIVEHGKILAAQRSEKMSLPLKWEFPGGKIYKDESEEGCLHREIAEELNIIVTIVKRLNSSHHKYEQFEIELIPFIVKYKSGQMKLTEHKEARWFTINQLQLLDWAPADLPILAQLKEDSLFE
jgi:8-oxo-dGTP diphosphatase